MGFFIAFFAELIICEQKKNKFLYLRHNLSVPKRKNCQEIK